MKLRQKCNQAVGLYAHAGITPYLCHSILSGTVFSIENCNLKVTLSEPIQI